eukprot:4416942-Heterocapsa_arctica.AAC.1
MHGPIGPDETVGRLTPSRESEGDSRSWVFGRTAVKRASQTRCPLRAAFDAVFLRACGRGARRAFASGGFGVASSVLVRARLRRGTGILGLRIGLFRMHGPRIGPDLTLGSAGAQAYAVRGSACSGCTVLGS